MRNAARGHWKAGIGAARRARARVNQRTVGPGVNSAGVADKALVLPQQFHRLDRQRTGKQKTLEHIAAFLAEEFLLFFGLDAFRDGAQLQLMPECNDRANDCHVVLVVGHVTYEGPIDLQRVYRQTFEIGQR